MLSCKEVALMLSQADELSLSFGRRMSLRMHTMMCRLCGRYRRQLKVVDRAARAIALADDEPVDATLSEESRIRIRTLLEG